MEPVGHKGRVCTCFRRIHILTMQPRNYRGLIWRPVLVAFRGSAAYKSMIFMAKPRSARSSLVTRNWIRKSGDQPPILA
jgi:hypothetical protein